MKRTVLALAALATAATIAASAQEPTFAPAKGQSIDQQTQDMAACRSVAVQQSGFDPAKAPAAKGERVRGAARGAAVGAAAGAIGGDASKGAAAGAAAGTVAGGARKRRAGREQQQNEAGYQKALIGCMQGKGYSVRQ